MSNINKTCYSVQIAKIYNLNKVLVVNAFTQLEAARSWERDRADSGRAERVSLSVSGWTTDVYALAAGAVVTFSSFHQDASVHFSDQSTAWNFGSKKNRKSLLGAVVLP